MIRAPKLFFTFAALILFTLNSKAQDNWLDKVDIYLHTVDRGTMIYDNFGHTAIRVHNRNTNQDVVYNWGIFNFTDPVEFSLKFYKGILIYQLGVYSFETAQQYYQREQRTVWEDKINFNNKQKEIFLKLLDWNYLPENRDYQYHYFFDNCSTRVRDYLDKALDGQVKSILEKEKAGRTFRDTVQEGYKTNPEIYFSLDLLMNGNIDREMNKWEEMFLPEKLRDHLMSLEIDNKFFSSSIILYDYKSPSRPWLNGFHIFALIFSVILAAIFFSDFRKIKVASRISWSLGLLISMVLGIFGLTMLLNWIISGHIDLHHNWNMLLLWPTDLLLLWPIIAILRKGPEINPSPKVLKFWNKYFKLHLLFNVIFLLVWITGLSGQSLFNTAIFVCPLYSLFLYLIFRTYQSPETRNFSYGIE